MQLRRYVVLLGLVVGSLGVGLFLGAAQPRAAVTETGCAKTETTNGKPICVTEFTGLAQASRTPDGGVEHYLTHSFTISNSGASSTLTNLTVTIEWADVGASTTSAYRPQYSDSTADPDAFYCTEGSTANTLTCTTPKSLAPGAYQTYGPLVFRTATNLAVSPASATTVTVKASAKEQSPPPKSTSGKVAFVEVPNTTTYEGSSDLDVSEAGGGAGGITTTLATAASGGPGQSSTLNVPAANAPARGLFSLLEESSFTCPTELTSYGLTCLPGTQQVTTTTTPGFSPVNLQITWIGNLPGGTSEGDIVVVHERFGGATVRITAACSGAVFTGGQPPSSEWDPNGCRRVRITRGFLPGGLAKLEIDVWDVTNGKWTYG